MYEYDQENDATRETLAQLQVHMGTILEHLQAYRENAIVVNLTNVIIVTTATGIALVVVDLVDTIVQPVVVSQPLFQVGPSRFVVSYPWGMPHNYTPRFGSGNPSVSYQPFVASSSNGNSDAFL